jgi:hypothetical protein
VKESSEKAFFTNDTINVRAKKSGLPEGVSRAYLLLFTDYVGNFDLQKEFDKNLRFSLASLGISTETKMRGAEVFISGELKFFAIFPAQRITNTAAGLFYALRLNYSVFNPENQVIQKDKMEENILVADTNTYPYEKVFPILVQSAARHTAEAICYGWQLSYSRTTNQVTTLGEFRETNYYTNRSK